MHKDRYPLRRSSDWGDQTGEERDRRGQMVQFIEAWIGLYAGQDQDEGAFPDRHAGQSLVEYALLVWFIAIVVFVAVVFLREKLLVVYSRIGNSLT